LGFDSDSRYVRAGASTEEWFDEQTGRGAVLQGQVTGVEDVAQRQGLDVADVPGLKVVTVTFDKMEAHIQIVEEGGKQVQKLAGARATKGCVRLIWQAARRRGGTV
jgi:hypothetical protein